MGKFYMGIIVFLAGAAAVLFNKKAAHEAVKSYYKYNYKLVGKEINEKVGRIGYIIVGSIFMILGLLIMINIAFSKSP
ncbi:MAG: hypothetical protein QOC96_352 [Acidobacteriota bacterium]|jgi:hypothetical protein|nr:hypothetical protein [Acidobacteriota bacterium]